MRRLIIYTTILLIMANVGYAQTYGFMQFDGNPIQIAKTDRPLYLGEFTITHYCPCEICCGKTDGITKSGVKAQANRTIAADESIPFGTELIIDGKTYVVEDRGSAIKSQRLDIFCDTHSEAITLGKTTKGVWK